MQESRACNIKHYRVAGLTNRVGDRYFGALQIKLATAKDVLKHYPELLSYLDTSTDEEIQAKLILDDEWNIRVGSKYLLMLGINEKPDIAITAYNQGMFGARSKNSDTFHYTTSVKKYYKELTS
jgi:soluble lytic murein transglycosylase-like protein